MSPRLSESTAQAVKTIGSLSTVGFMFVLAVVMGAGAGYVLDDWLGTSPILFLVFFFLGVAAGVLNVYRMAARFLK
jgi:ATP synthase protein I